MKKFLSIVLLLAFLGVGGWYAVYRKGFYLDLAPEAAVTAAFSVQEDQILYRDAAGQWQPFTVRGVDVLSTVPGSYASTYAPEKADYLRWLEQIGAMGANTVRVCILMDADFYDALYEYNTENAAPLYLLQGISVSDAANAGSADAYSDGFFAQLKADGRAAVDIIHGKKSIPAGHGNGSGDYRRDVSPWVLGYIVGQSWNSETVAYTDHSKLHDGIYQGTYFYTAEQATPFEALLAQVMDEIAVYESKKYKAQRLFSFISEPSADFLQYESDYAVQLKKYCAVDMENVLTTDALLSGRFASYLLYDYCEDYARCLAEPQKTAYRDILAVVTADTLYGGYLQMAKAHHTVPVVAAGFSTSSARGCTVEGQPPLTEQQQGAALAEMHAQVLEAGWAGGTISAWQDSWERRSWNTAFATEITRNLYWHDVQTAGQNCGLMAFEPGRTESVCTVDGVPTEWAEADVLLQTSGKTVSVRSDAEGLYLLLRGVSPAEKLYLPLSISGKLGATAAEGYDVTFARAADHLLCLDGMENTRLLVQERCDPVRAGFLAQITGEDPYVNAPAAGSTTFVPLTMVLQNQTLVENPAQYTEEQILALRRLGLWETGRLVHGCADPAAADYNSLADYCWGENCVEIRLPWLLLNFYDPSDQQVHKDYYENYGVEGEYTAGIWLGIGSTAETIPMEQYRLSGWTTPKTRERLKASYAVLQQAWKGEH